MVRAGKERAVPVAQEQHEAPETVQDTRWLNGVNRQLRPDAQSQRQAASQAAAEKRKANAMPEDERKRKRAEHAKLVRAQEKAAREAAAAAAAAERELTLQQLNDELQAAHEEAHPDDPEGCSPVSEDEWDAFQAWVATTPPIETCHWPSATAANCTNCTQVRLPTAVPDQLGRVSQTAGKSGRGTTAGG